MNQTQKRVLSILAAAAMTCGALPQSTPLSLLQPVLTANAEASAYEDFSYEEKEDGGITIKEYIGSDDAVEIPAEIDGKPVTKIEDWAFFNKQISSVLILDSITTIGSQAFNSCTKLKEVVLPGYITAIADGSFSGCSSLTKVIMPGCVKSIGMNAFSSCTELEDLHIPESVTSIGGSAFRDTAWLKKKQEENPLVIVNHILVDGSTCKNEVGIPEDVTSICDLAFNGCKTITSVFIPSGVESIGSDAFYNCSALKHIDMQDGLKKIGDNAFYCAGLENIRIPDTVTEIGTAAFFGCENLQFVELPENLKELKSGRMGTFQGCTSLETIEIPESVTNIGVMAFATCTLLGRVIIHGSTTTIGARAFYGCAQNLTLCGYAGSPAQTYASQNDLNFKELNAKFSGVSLTLTDDLGLNFFATGVP